MSPIDERLKSLNIVLPDVVPPVVDGCVPPFARFARSGYQIHAGFCFCFMALILAFTSFCTNAFGIALSAAKLIMAFVVA